MMNAIYLFRKNFELGVLLPEKACNLYIKKHVFSTNEAYGKV